MTGITVYGKRGPASGAMPIPEGFTKLNPGGKPFRHYLYFGRDYLDGLPERVRKHFREEEFPAVFGEVANSPAPSRDSREAYLRSLLETYRRMEGGLALGPSTLLIGPEREGAILARRLGWADRCGAAAFPNAKRLNHQGGVAVGFDDIAVPAGIREAVIVDGAVASGATLMAMLRSLQEKGVSRASVCIVHGTERSLRILDRFAGENALDLTIHIGFVSGSLNGKFYAVHPDGRLVVGDLGDTISDLADGRKGGEA